MFCTQCGKEVHGEDRFCSKCGASQTPVVPTAARRMVRPRYGRKVAGVGLGLANYLDLDVTLVRVLFIILTLVSGGIVLIGYLAAWIIMPEEDYRVPAAPAPATQTDSTQQARS